MDPGERVRGDKVKETFGRQIEEDVGERFVIKDEDYLMIATVLLLLWLVALLGLLICSEKELRRTFFSIMTGKQYNEALFRSGEDEIKMQVFATHSSYNRHFEEDIKQWLGENWNDWHVSRPGWLTGELIGRIPGRFLPGGEDGDVLGEIEVGEERELFMAGQKGRRKSLRGAIEMAIDYKNLE